MDTDDTRVPRNTFEDSQVPEPEPTAEVPDHPMETTDVLMEAATEEAPTSAKEACPGGSVT